MRHPYDDRVWVTKDGRKFVWKDMTDDHLANCMHMILRNAKNKIINQLMDGELDYYEKVIMTYDYYCLNANRIKEYLEWRVQNRGVKI